MRLGMLVLSLFALTGCGDSGTGPGDAAQIAGDWRFSWTMSEGDGFTCVTIVDFTIQQSGADFSGLQDGAGLTQCTDTEPQQFGGETIVGGEIDGDEISFGLGTFSGSNEGTVTGSSIVGEAVWTIDLGGPPLVLSGDFTAVRL
jgi:hypothetical protein